MKLNKPIKKLTSFALGAVLLATSVTWVWGQNKTAPAKKQTPAPKAVAKPIAKPTVAQAPKTQSVNFKETDVLPMTKDIRTGVLPNGMNYFIRKNQEPQQRAEIRLVVKTGSVMEEDDQQGLAHFTEHMAFNGSKNFKKNELVDYLESVGIKFGADLNAYTSFDETVYMLQIPTDKKELLDKGLLVMQDWASGVSFEAEEIDKERGVVIEEWRLGKGAEDRMNKTLFPIIFGKSRYTNRLPIGTKEILETFKHDRIRQYYKDWYRPELMAIAIVGDFDPMQMEKQIIAQFSKIPKSVNPKPRTEYEIPNTSGIEVGVAKDKEARMQVIQLGYKHPHIQSKIYGNFLKRQAYNVATGIVSMRLSEIGQQPTSALAFAGVNYSDFLGGKDMLSVFAVPKPNKATEAFETVVTEIFRAKNTGFTQSELDRVKEQTLAQYEQYLKEKDKTESAGHIGEIVRHFLNGESITGIEMEYQLTKNILSKLTLKEVNDAFKSLVTDDNVFATISGPDKENVVYPSADDFKKIYNKIKSSNIEAYKDEVLTAPLLAQKPTAGKIVSQTENKAFGYKELKLSNGVTVVLKSTDFKDDEINLRGFSWGGTSLASDKDFMPAKTAADIVNNSGLGPYNSTQLQKYMTGKIANISPSSNELGNSLYGSSSVKDAEMMFQMLYLYMTNPRFDNDGLENYKASILTMTDNKLNSPEGVFADTINKVMSKGNIRRLNMDEKFFPMLDMEKSKAFYKEQFNNAANFTFVLVGKIDEKTIIPLIETYIASLPSNPSQKMTFKDLGLESPQGIVKREIKKGSEPKSSVRLTYHGKTNYSYKNSLEFNAFSQVLSIMLRESMREDKGGVYGVGAYGGLSKLPKNSFSMTIAFGCSPDNKDMLVKTVKEQIELLKKDGASEKNLQKVKETIKRSRETGLKENNFWMSRLYQLYSGQETFEESITQFDKLVEGINSDTIKKWANECFKDGGNYAEFVLMPEK